MCLCEIVYFPRLCAKKLAGILTKFLQTRGNVTTIHAEASFIKTGEKTEHSKNSIDSALAGSVAGFVSRVVVSPLDVVKIRWQLSSHSNVTFSNTIKHVIDSHGWKGLFRGNAWGLALWISYGAVQFPAYEKCKDLSGESSVGRVFAGSLAASFATMATFPLDAMRTRRISSHSHGHQNIFRGLGPGLLSIAPMSGMTFALHEYLLNLGLEKAFSGLLAGMVARTIIFPLDTIKRRMMAQGLEHVEHGHVIKHYSGALDCAVTIFKEEGPRAFFRGISPSLIKTGIGSSITFFVYETVLHWLNGAPKVLSSDNLLGIILPIKPKKMHPGKLEKHHFHTQDMNDNIMFLAFVL